MTIIEDDEITIRAFARQIGLFLVGCYSHRYNLAPKDVLADHHDVNARVRHLMQKMGF